MDSGSDPGSCEMFFDPLDALSKGTNLRIMSLLFLLNGSNNAGELLIFTLQRPELAVQDPISVDISKDSSISEAIEGMVDGPIKGVI